MSINILLDKLPHYTKSGLKIRTDFRESIKFELLMQDTKLTKEEKILYALNLYYYDLEKVTDVEIAVKDILWFYSGGKKENDDEKEKIKQKEETNENKKQVYSYEFDDEYIYSAFMEQYGIDLNTIKYLHWWKFKALFNSLNKKTHFVEIMGYRAIDLSKIKDKEEKKKYEKLKRIYALKDMRSDEEKEADFAEELW